jgi:hypothetical protein
MAHVTGSAHGGAFRTGSLRISSGVNPRPGVSPPVGISSEMRILGENYVHTYDGHEGGGGGGG